MITDRDRIYYDYRFLNIKPKKIKWKLYCWFRKKLTLRESPSKVTLWDLEKEIYIPFKEGFEQKKEDNENKM